MKTLLTATVAGIGLLAFVTISGVSANGNSPATGTILENNVTLQFRLADESVVVTTADSDYAISTQGHEQSTKSSLHQEETGGAVEVFSEYAVELTGTVANQPGTDHVLVTCHGLFSASETSSKSADGGDDAVVSEMTCTIDASAIVSPGKPVIIARSGERTLEMTYLPAP